MKIAIFHNLPPGGAKRVVFEQTKGLLKKHIVDVYEISSDKKDFLDFSSLSCNVYPYSFSLNTKLPKPFKRLLQDYHNFISLQKIHKQIARDIDERNYDIVIVHHDKYTQSPFILKFLKTRNVYYIEELLRIVYEPELSPVVGNLFKKSYEYFTRHIRKSIDKKNAQAADVIIANSMHIKQKVKFAYNKIAGICHPGVDLNIFHNIPSKRKYLLFFGEPAPINGYELIEQIINNLPENIKLKVVNFFAGQKKLTDSDLAHLYSQSIASLCLGKNEPFGLVPLESMACQTPVIALNEGGYKETVKEGKTGYLIERNSEDLLTAIKRLTVSPSLVETLGKQGRKHVMQNFTWEKHIACLEKYL